jgi:hypothetical protein
VAKYLNHSKRTIRTSEARTEGKEIFVPLEAPASLRKFFNEARDVQAKTVISSTETNLKLNSYFADIKTDPETFALQLSESPPPLISPLNLSIAVYLGSSSLFCMKSTFLKQEDNRLYFQEPKIIYAVHRRKDPRFSIPRGYELSGCILNLTPSLPQLSFKLYDISPNGLALLVPQDEESSFQLGLEIAKITLRIRGKELKLSATIRNKNLHEPFRLTSKEEKQKPLVRIGLEINQISQQDRELLTQYVLEHTAQYFSKLF